MARVKDLWFSEVKDPADSTRKIKQKTKRHPDRGGSKTAKRWLAVWIDPAGKEATKAFHQKERARTYARDQESDVERGEHISPREGRAPLGPLAKRWISLRKLSGHSAVRYETAYRLHVEPTFGHRKVKSVRPSEVLEWLRALEKRRGTSVQSLAFHILQGTFDLAVADGKLKDNPARSPIVPRIEIDRAERPPWDIAKVWSVINQHPAPYRTVAILEAGCGMREGEAFAAAPSDFDFDAGRVAVHRQVVKVGKTIAYKLPKGGKARAVPLPLGVARLVKAHMEQHPPVAIKLPWMTEDGRLEDSATFELLFVWRGGLLLPPLAEGARTSAARGRLKKVEGKTLRASNYNPLVWKVALSRAGVIPPPENDARGALRFVEAREDGQHALRHWFSTTLLDAGVNLAGVMDFMGHSRKGSRLPITIGVYGHTTEETFEAARTAIDQSLFRLRPVQDRQLNGTGAERGLRHGATG